MKISARTKEHPTPVVCEVNIPAVLAEKVKLVGEEAVNALVEDSWIINAQALMRRLMVAVKNKAGVVTRAAMKDAEVQAALTAWRPDVRTIIRQTAFEKAASSLDKLTPEERKQLLAKLQAIK